MRLWRTVKDCRLYASEWVRNGLLFADNNLFYIRNVGAFSSHVLIVLYPDGVPLMGDDPIAVLNSLPPETELALITEPKHAS